MDKGLDLGDLLDLYFVALVNDDLDGRDNGDVGVHALISGSSSSSTALLKQNINFGERSSFSHF